MQSNQLFKTLLKSAKDELKSSQLSGAQAFEKGDTPLTPTDPRR